MSYSGYKSSPRGSRGYSRGGSSGYRGSSRGGGGDGTWRGGGGRGYSGSSRGSSRGTRGYSSGGGKWERGASSGSYESRPRYSSGSDRYSSRDEGSYRYRGDDSISSYTSRDHSHRASSPERKRMRPDYSPASSVHRSSQYGDDSYSSRSYGHSGYENKRMSGGYGSGEDRRTSMFREERERIRSDDYEFRKPLSVGGTRHSTPRGSYYRGWSSSRGMRSSGGYSNRRPMSYRGGGGGRGGFMRKRIVDSYTVRKRMVPGKSQEYLRRLKLYRLQRLRRLRERAENEEEGSGDEEEEEEEIEEEVEITDEENEDADGKEEEDEEDKEKKEDNEDEDTEEKKEEKKKKKVVKKVVKIIKKIKRVPKERKDSEKGKDEGGEGKDIHVTVKQDSEGRDVDAPVRKNYLGQPFIKLECPHCKTTGETFKEYLNHLYTSKHQSAMMSAAVKVRKELAKLRMDQRNEQRDIDKECEDLNMRTFYCLICKLNYRSLKSEHMQSAKHQEMKKFLYPYCKVCRIACKTPMMYENHICSLDHLKRKYYIDKKNAERQEGNDINMDNFMVLDQVGSGEEESESEESSEKGDKEKEDKGDEKPNEEMKEEKKPKKPKKVVNLGSEYCKKITIYFCDLCKNFLPRIEDQEQALAVHCRGQRHLHWYVKKKDQEALRKRAERIHRMREEQRKAEMKAEVKDEPMDEDASEKNADSKKKDKSVEEMDVDGNMDDKTWNEVNKDLGDLLRQVEEPGNKSDEEDDEEDSRAAGRRYDRFKHSEKGKPGEEEKGISEEKGVKAEVVNGEKDDA